MKTKQKVTEKEVNYVTLISSTIAYLTLETQRFTREPINTIGQCEVELQKCDAAVEKLIVIRDVMLSPVMNRFIKFNISLNERHGDIIVTESGQYELNLNLSSAVYTQVDIVNIHLGENQFTIINKSIDTIKLYQKYLNGMLNLLRSEVPGDVMSKFYGVKII